MDSPVNSPILNPNLDGEIRQHVRDGIDPSYVFSHLFPRSEHLLVVVKLKALGHVLQRKRQIINTGEEIASKPGASL
jgi:hypothetical protein